MAKLRTVEMILADWRAIERAIALEPSRAARRRLEARIETLRDEHRRVVASLEADALALLGGRL